MIGYYLVFGVAYGISMLPMWVLFGLSRIFYLIVYYLIGYRKAVVTDNLRQAFPEKPETEIEAFRRQFYQYFCDLMVETLKGLSQSDKSLTRRVKLLNPEVCENLLTRNQGAILLISHYGNFEWLVARMTLALNQRNIPSYAIYSPFTSPLFDRLMRVMRSRRGLSLIPMRRGMINTLRTLQDGPCMVGIVSDQSPSRQPQLYFTRFLGRPTAWHTSTAKIALKAQCPIYFADLRKVRRGYYSLELKKIEVSEFLPLSADSIHALTDHCTRLLEAVLLDQPAFWLWSHKRWKHVPGARDAFSPLLQKNLS